MRDEATYLEFELLLQMFITIVNKEHNKKL